MGPFLSWTSRTGPFDVGRPRDQRSRDVRRFGGLLLALLQLTAAGFVPVADAALQGPVPVEVLHVEASHDEACQPPHDHVFCQLCRVMSVAGWSSPPPAAAPAAADPAPASSPDDRESQPRTDRVCRGLGSRAPPKA